MTLYLRTTKEEEILLQGILNMAKYAYIIESGMDISYKHQPELFEYIYCYLHHYSAILDTYCYGILWRI